MSDSPESHDQTPARSDEKTATPPGIAPQGLGAIDDYRLIELIGEGGMGEVYKAEQRGAIRRLVALKVIRLGLDTKTVIARFDAERQALALMNHPNIAKVFGGGTTGLGRPYFVMEYVAGETITAYCDRRRLPIRGRLELFAQVCEAVQHAHTKGIIHRDLKASNVLVAEQDGKPTPKVIDFGVAKALNQRLTEQTLFTETGRLVGTPAYASPEQAEGGVDLDTRSDVYSLGVLLYELLTGALPFDPTKLRELAYDEMQRIIREVDPPRPSTFYNTLSDSSREAAQKRAASVEELASALRQELEWIPLRAMRKERSERYQTAADFARDIANYLAGKPLIAAPDSRIYRWHKSIRRNRRLVAAVAAVMLALLLGIVMTSWQAWRAQQQRKVAEENAADARKRLAQAEASAKVLGELFEGIQLNVVQGRNTELLVAVLQASEPKIEEILTEPSWRAEHLVLLGKAYRILGETERARELLEKAQSLAEQSFEAALASGRFDPGKKQARTYIEALEKLGALHLELGNYAQAEPLLRQALQLAEAHFPAGDALVTHQLANVGTSLYAQGKYKEALEFYDRALARANADPINHPPGERASIAMQRGGTFLSMGDFEGASAAFESADAIFQEAGLTQTTQYATLLSYRSFLAQAQQDNEEALKFITAAIDLHRQLGPDLEPLYRATVLDNRALILGAMGQGEAAAADRKEAMRLRQRAMPNMNIPTLVDQAWAAAYRAWNLQEAGQLQAALDAVDEGIEMYQQLLEMAQQERASNATRPVADKHDWDADILVYEKLLLDVQQRWAQITAELGGAREALPVIRDCLSRQRTLYDGDKSEEALRTLAISQWILADVMLLLEPQNVQEPLTLLVDANRKLIEGALPTGPTPAGRPSVRERVLRRLLGVYEMLGDQQNVEQISRELAGLAL